MVLLFKRKPLFINFIYRPDDNFSHISLSDSYVCTLFASCFEEIKETAITRIEIGQLSAGSVLHTARELLISEALLRMSRQNDFRAQLVEIKCTLSVRLG